MSVQYRGLTREIVCEGESRCSMQRSWFEFMRVHSLGDSSVLTGPSPASAVARRKYKLENDRTSFSMTGKSKISEPSSLVEEVLKYSPQFVLRE